MDVISHDIGYFFGCLHFSNPEVEKIGYSILIYYIGTGFFLGILTIIDKGIELALGFHIANNLINIFIINLIMDSISDRINFFRYF